MSTSAVDQTNATRHQQAADLCRLATVQHLQTQMELTACPLCGGAEHKLLFDRLDHTHYVTNDRFKIVRCRRCSMVFVNPRPSRDTIRHFYPPEFYEVNVDPGELLKQKQATLEARARLLSGLAPGRLLDIGCQKGEFLFWMAQRRWQVSGVEFSETPPNLFQLPIHYGRLDTAPFAPRAFDVVTLWAVLEHVHDPVETLRQVERLLADNGRVFVLVPNFRSLPGRVMRHDDVPRHLLMFTPRTLRLAAKQAGLRARRIVFSDDIFSGSTRGILNFVVKLAFGESYDEVLAQNRSAERWPQFAGMLAGKPSSLVSWVDSIDQRLTPKLDAIVRKLRSSFIMTAELERSAHQPAK